MVQIKSTDLVCVVIAQTTHSAIDDIADKSPFAPCDNFLRNVSAVAARQALRPAVTKDQQLLVVSRITAFSPTDRVDPRDVTGRALGPRSEEHTSELHSH